MPMETAITFARNPRRSGAAAFIMESADSALAFHRSLPGYAPTPMHGLDRLADRLGVRRIWVKDEGRRFGLKAFKALGAAYGLCRVLARHLDLSGDASTFDRFLSPALRDRLAKTTCTTATDGNHGRAVAWAAERLGCRAVIFMPKGTSTARIANVEMFGAQVKIVDGTYDDAVAQAREDARGHGWVLVQDMAWDGYEEIPAWIMAGYRTIVAECFEVLGHRKPSHVVLQAGVGSFAAAVQADLLSRFGNARPTAVIVEPDRAACFYESMDAGGGRARKATGDLQTIMAGLACGMPSTLAWEVLSQTADLFVACPDRVACRGMRVLGNPLDGDPAVVSGESGAVGLGLVYEALTDPALVELKEAMGLNPASEVLVISTEADTDPEMYRRVVWGDG